MSEFDSVSKVIDLLFVAYLLMMLNSVYTIIMYINS